MMQFSRTTLLLSILITFLTDLSAQQDVSSLCRTLHGQMDEHAQEFYKNAIKGSHKSNDLKTIRTVIHMD